VKIKKKGINMLVLRRKVGESIVLAGVINISVLAVEGVCVKIGISAPPDVTIVREELLRAVGTKQVPDQNTPIQSC
jgi:carbon storage regulator